MTAPWRRQATSSEPAVQLQDPAPDESAGAVAATAATEQAAELVNVRRDLLSLTAEVSRNHGLLVEVQAMARRLLDTRLSFTERDGALALADALRPRSVHGVRKIRVGSAHDGGYVLLDDLTATTSVLCGGAGDNVDFERALAAAGHQVHVYDHTVAALPGDGDGVTFFREPLGPEGTGLAAALGRFDALTGDEVPESSEPGATIGQSSADLLLKVDIDGGEWALFADAGEHLPRFRQIALELQIVGRVGEHEIDAGRRQLRQLFEAIADEDLIGGQG